MEERYFPERLREALERYVEHHIETGGFLRAVLENDLKNSFARADLESRACMFAIVSYCYNDMPADCWGSKEAVKEWLAKRQQGGVL